MVMTKQAALNDFRIGSLRVWLDQQGSLHASIGNQEFGIEEWDLMWSPTAGSHGDPSFVEAMVLEGKNVFQQFWLTREEGKPPVICYQVPALNESGHRGATCGRVICHGWHGSNDHAGFEKTEGVFVPDFNVGMIATIIVMILAVAYAGYRSVG